MQKAQGCTLGPWLHEQPALSRSLQPEQLADRLQQPATALAVGLLAQGGDRRVQQFVLEQPKRPLDHLLVRRRQLAVELAEALRLDLAADGVPVLVQPGDHRAWAIVSAQLAIQ